MRLQPNRPYMVGMGCIGGLIVILLLVVCCPMAVDEETFATIGTNSQTNNDLKSSISVSVSDNVDLTANFERSSSEFVSGTAAVAVGASNVKNYKLYLNATNGTQNLKPTTSGVTQVIGPVSGSMTATNYSANMNKWGYNLTKGTALSTDSTSYKAVPTASTLVDTNNDPSVLNNYSLNFAMAVDTSLPAGSYTNGVTLSVVAEPVIPEAPQPTTPTWSTITTMQEMTPAICAEAGEGDRIQLADSRDGNKYLVTKLRDGNCWMTENLALMAPSGGRVLKPADSDVTSNWTMPETKTSTGSGQWASASSATMAVSMNTGNGYGTYFNFNAVTANTAKNTSGGIATSSICPKGWRLPTASTSYDSISGSFYYLLNKYGAATDNSTSSSIARGEILGFRAGGYVGTSGGFGDLNSVGYYWSSVAYSSSNTYVLYSSATNLKVSYNVASTRGNSVRCLAR